MVMLVGLTNNNNNNNIDDSNTLPVWYIANSSIP